MVNLWRAERSNRLRLAAQAIRYGINFLDEVLGGILPIDLVVIGAATGIGKTDLACLIAKSAIQQGRQVIFYALEAFQTEIHSRIKYQAIAEYFFAHRQEFPSFIHLNYFDWAHGKFDHELAPLEEKIAEDLHEQMHMLEIISPTHGELSAKSITQMTKDWSTASLVILDHLHKLDLGDETENRGIKNAVSELRDYVNSAEVPVIAMSHLRKEERRSLSLIPATEELHGSSEISKQANAVITFAPVKKIISRDKTETKLSVGHTFVRVTKARLGAEGATHYAGLLKYDLSRHAYMPAYWPFECDKWATEVTPLPRSDFTHWMKDAKEFNAPVIQPRGQRDYAAGERDD